MMKRPRISPAAYLLALLLPLSAHLPAQNGVNYIRTETQISGDSRKITAYTILDGLGREIGKASNGVSGGGEYVYSLNEYNGDQPVTRRWLPVVGSGTMDYNVRGAVTGGSQSQYSDSCAFDRYSFDALDRQTAQYKAGAVWRGKPATVSYITNGSNDVKLYSASVTGMLYQKGYYKTGCLRGTRTVNEDGLSVTVYTDAFGKKILERRGSDNDTYFVYDDPGRLRLVLMPGFQNEAGVERHTYRYDYDLRGNVTSKVLPGCEAIGYLYDADNRCVSMQDGLLRSKGLYRFTLYDFLGRIAVQGLSSSRLDNSKSATVTFCSGSSGIGGTDYKTDDGSSLNLTVKALEVVNYYDGYGFLSGSMKDVFQGLSGGNASTTVGYLSGSLVLASNGENIATVNSYDRQGNLLVTETRGLDGSIEKTENTYTYTNKTATSRSTIAYAGRDKVVYDISNSYDARTDRLAGVTYKATVGKLSSDEKKVVYSYDRLGRMTGISRPVNSGGVTCAYDLHGWIESIQTSSFCEKLHYADGPGKPLYSGNISSLTWKSGNRTDKGYKYTYDCLGRITNGTYGESDFSTALGHYDETIGYDANSNVTSLIRNGLRQDNAYAAIDSLCLSYRGNQLSSVTESAASVLNVNSMDVKNGANNIRYNANGSLVSDGTRGITNITYDDNNNPRRIQFSNGSVTKFIYTATGRKLRTIHYTAPENIHVETRNDYDGIESHYLTVDSTDYMLGGMLLYKNAKPSQLLFDGGYIRMTYPNSPLAFDPTDIAYPRIDSLRVVPDSIRITHNPIIRTLVGRNTHIVDMPPVLTRLPDIIFEYYFFNKDHLGNVREVIDDNGIVRQRTDYYPYGTSFSDAASTISPGLQPFKYNNKELDMMYGLNSYDYGARRYYSAIPMWDRVDPLAEKYYNVSPYAYCHNNPVNTVDPDGTDDYFSQSGMFLYSSGTTPNIYIRQGENNILFQKFDLRSRRNMQMAANIVGHYAREVGVSYNMNGGNGTVGLSTLHSVRNPNALAATTNGNIFVKMTNGHLNTELYNIHNLRGTLRHENEHKKDQEAGLSSDMARHSEIIIKEMTYSDFVQGSSNYQLGQIGQLQNYLTGVYQKDKTRYHELIRQANSVLKRSGYKISKDNYEEIE